MISPLTMRLLPKPGKSSSTNRHRMYASRLARDFEVFACVPASASGDPMRRYPAVLVLDANIEFATVAETAARMAAAGMIEERSEEHTSELQSLKRISYAGFCLKKKNRQ